MSNLKMLPELTKKSNNSGEISYGFGDNPIQFGYFSIIWVGYF